MKRMTVAFQIFAAMMGIALGAAIAVGLIARRTMDQAFFGYVQGLPTPPAGMGQGRQMMLGAAEQTFVTGVNRGVVAGALIAVLIALVVAWWLSRYLSRPLQRLEVAAEQLASGDLSH
ncbi:MAG: methyl-accepting chemotaxis protein, partial [Actinobacteria bacterium]